MQIDLYIFVVTLMEVKSYNFFEHSHINPMYTFCNTMIPMPHMQRAHANQILQFELKQRLAPWDANPHGPCTFHDVHSNDMFHKCHNHI